MSGGTLERDLEAVGASLDTAPPSGGFAEDVITRIVTERSPVPRGRRRWVAIAVAGVFIAVAAVVAAQPAARKAIADFLGIGGIRIEQKSTPTPSPSPTARYFRKVLGTQVSLAEARRSVDFPVRVPETMGDPDVVFFDPSIQGGEVNLTYATSGELPESTVAGIGLIIGEFKGGLASEFLRKTVGADAVVEEASVNGQRAFWIEGAHELTFRDSNGRTVARRNRLAGSVLIWRDAEVTYRLEAQISKEKAISIAESIS